MVATDPQVLSVERLNGTLQDRPSIRIKLTEMLGKAWEQVWLITAMWWLCALITVVKVKGEEHKAMLNVYSNCVGALAVAPFVLVQGVQAIRKHFGSLLLISFVAGLERNLTNSAMYSIGAGLKTALHGFNVVLTFLVAIVFGVDEEARACVFGCKCRGNLAMIPSLLLVSGGGLITALCGRKNMTGDALGIILQLSSGLCYALKYTVVKLLLGGHGGSSHSAEEKPSKMQIAIVANPIAALLSLIFVPFFESTWVAPGIDSVVVTGLCASGILIFEFRLTELTSPLTVAVLAILHNVVIVFYFVVFGGENMEPAQLYGFGVSSIGAIVYAGAKRIKQQDAQATELQQMESCR
eukprot:TRINITY_DN72990_c0_g1_i1.p1 TRINITY_DN72990_c0_g1~~TRINITY_DN72990_c0_g1_i1.p1  ORF type:complete len:353 (-),score=61.29 TRINITY_DN72990_c0_g1_i1:74-1132(-)